MEKEIKMEKFIKEIKNAHKNSQGFGDFDLIDSIKEALDQNDREKLKKIYYNTYECFSEKNEYGKAKKKDSIWEFEIKGEEFWQIFQEFLGSH